MPGVELTYPWRLLALIPLLAVTWFTVRPGRAVSRRLARFSLRAILLLAAVTALAEPRLNVGPRSSGTVFLLDASGSVEPSLPRTSQELSRLLDQLDPGEPVAVILFARSPAVAVPLRPARDLRLPPMPPPAVDRSATDQAAALRTAYDLLPNGGRIVLLGDGRETKGRAEEEILRHPAGRHPIFPVKLPGLDRPDLRLDSFEAPDRVAPGTRFTLAVTVSSNGPADGQLILSREPDGEAVRDVQFLQAGSQRFLFPQEPPGAGLLHYRAEVRGQPDRCPENNRLDAAVLVTAKPSLLYVAEEPEPRAMRRLLAENPNYLVVPVSPGRIGRHLVSARPGAVILDDVPHAAWEPDELTALDRFVRLGGGLLVLGGPNSFGPGGYARTTFENLLPVRCEPRETRRRRVVFVFLIDQSGSMGELFRGISKLEYARGAVLEGLRELRPEDAVGIVAFEAKPTAIVPPQPGWRAGVLRDALQKLIATGSTDLAAALRDAIALAGRLDAPRRHVLLLSDGKSKTPVSVEAAGAQARKSAVTVSVVVTGEDADAALLRSLAKACRGHFYRVEDLSSLPEIFRQETRLAKQELIQRGDFALRAAPEAELAGRWGDIPGVKGYVLTPLKKTARSEIRTGQGHPILAWWRFGLGRVAAFTSSFDVGWAARWVKWSGAASAWNQVLRTLTPAAGEERITVQTRQDGERIILEVTSKDVLPGRAAVTAQAARLGRRDEPQALPLERIGARRWRGEITPGEAGAYLFGVSVRWGEVAPANVLAGHVVPYSREWVQFGVDQAALQRLADLSGGRVLAANEPLPVVAGQEQWVDIAWAFALVAVGLFLIDGALFR